MQLCDIYQGLGDQAFRDLLALLSKTFMSHRGGYQNGILPLPLPIE